MENVVVIGAGQAGLSAAYHLRRLEVPDVVVLDANPEPGGAWQHRWGTLTMRDVHGIADLPGFPAPPHDDEAAARDVVPAYFADYERQFSLSVVRPVQVKRVANDESGMAVSGPSTGPLTVHTDRGAWSTRTLVNATGTWDSPFWPYYPGRETFLGRQLHTADYSDPESFAGQRVIVVGGGASAVQVLGELAPLTETLWVTRREPIWRTDDFNSDAGRAAVAMVEERVLRGLPPRSVVDVTGLMLRPQEEHARRLGAYQRHPMFERIEPDGVRWPDGSFAAADAIIWATGFRPNVGHLGPLRLRESTGGIRLIAREDQHTPTTAARDLRIQFVGYGPSASTIGANRAGRVAARSAIRWLRDHSDVSVAAGA